MCLAQLITASRLNLHVSRVMLVYDVCGLFRFVSCGGDRQIFQWDVMTGIPVRKFRGHDSEVNSV